MGTVVVSAVLLLLLAWFFWPSRSPGRRGGDNAELEQAEREVQEASNEETVRDWGPGTGQRPLP
jgi:hypothetical protein